MGFAILRAINDLELRIWQYCSVGIELHSERPRMEAAEAVEARRKRADNFMILVGCWNANFVSLIAFALQRIVSDEATAVKL